jgi:hypothetical protein
MAGFQALINQKSGERQGNPNPEYYSLAAKEYGAKGDRSCNSTLGNTIGSSCVFYDVTMGDIDLPCSNTEANCFDASGLFPNGVIGILSTSNSAPDIAYGTTTGWDFATGIGSVNVANLANKWPAGTTPHFTLSATPNALSIARGTSNTSTVAITALNKFSGSVTLAATGLPKGVTASFSPDPATKSSVLTLTASTTATLGTVTITITGTSGSLSDTTTFALTVNLLGNFTLSAAPTALTVAEGSSGTSTITIKPTDGFDQNVTLSVSANELPSGVTASFSPSSVTPPAGTSSALTLNASSSATVGTRTLTITGASGSLSHTTKVELTVTN